MEPSLKLPLELEEEILSRLALSSLSRLKAVCKQWRALFSDMSFVSRARPQFIFVTNSYKVYSIDIIGLNTTEPTLHKTELRSMNNIPCHRDSDVSSTTITTCDEFLFCNSRFKDNRMAIWNPVLRQLKWIEYKARHFFVCGLGYDNTSPNKVYKILGHFLPYHKVIQRHHQRVAIYECASHSVKYIYTPDEDWPLKDEDTRTHMSLNGSLYWITNNSENENEYFIRSFDFSREVFKTFCLLPCQKNRSSDELVLAPYKGDRFSLLNHSYVAKKIDIWVTKKRIDDTEEVVWMKLMTLPATNLPKISQTFVRTGISYYIYDKTLVMCCGSDGTGGACIYIVRGDMCKKIQLPSMYYHCCHCVYAPNVASLPLEFR